MKTALIKVIFFFKLSKIKNIFLVTILITGGLNIDCKRNGHNNIVFMKIDLSAQKSIREFGTDVIKTKPELERYFNYNTVANNSEI